MLSMLLAYDDEGNIIETLDWMTITDEEGNVIGAYNFDAIELAGEEMTQLWRHEGAAGSKVWPEWIDRPKDFRVEKEGPPGHKRAVALVHRRSGLRRERSAVEHAIADRITRANGQPADIRDLVGGPGRPLRLDENGRTLGRSGRSGSPAHLRRFRVGEPRRETDTTPTGPATPSAGDSSAPRSR